MSEFVESEYLSYLWKGQLREAVDYLSKFPEKRELHDKYIQVFEEGQYFQRTDNQIVGAIDKIYQEYYRNVFWKRMQIEVADKLLLQELEAFCEKTSGAIDGDTEDKIMSIIKGEGYECLCGKTQGYYGPYIWKSSTVLTYEVELPDCIEPYPVVMMDGFISRSWLDFISFGRTGAGGWADENGTLCCVKGVYDTNSDDFIYSFLKHEAQHAYDKKRFPNITSTDLEYRAKLVELIYCSDVQIIKKLIDEADNTNPDNSHAVAAYRIISNLSKKIYGCDYMNDENAWKDQLSDVKKYAKELLEESSEALSA